MQVIHSLSEVVEAIPTVLTVGVFDGVHLGHQALIRRVVEAAHTSQRRAAVVTFFPHPQNVLGHTQRYYLTDSSEKSALFEQIGLDLSVVLEFNMELAQVRATAFAEQLVHRLHMNEMWIGHDFSLGYKREGDAAFLRRLGPQLGFTLNAIDTTTLSSEIVSSSLIRAALQAGDVGTAQRYLGRPFQLSGTVVAGAKRGGRIGIPTANLSVWAEKARPAGGVYACQAYIGQRRAMAVTNIGVRPTFDHGASTVEAHLLDFSGDLYGQRLTLDFIAHLRPEQKFDSIEALVAQIQADISHARAILG